MDPLANSAFTTSGALIDCVDKKMVLVLRDNSKLFGVLRSFDQYGNLVFQDSYQRIYVDDCYADVPKGVYLIRGENVVLMGEIVRRVRLYGFSSLLTCRISTRKMTSSSNGSRKTKRPADCRSRLRD